jgi:site-specific recombinase
MATQTLFSVAKASTFTSLHIIGQSLLYAGIATVTFSRIKLMPGAEVVNWE